MMIDEAIAQYKEKAKYFKSTTNVAYALELEQIAEWLEELKCYRNDNDFSDYADRLHKIAFHSGYNKAIDDLSNILKENYDYLPQIFSQEAFDGYIDEYAEQLKAGEDNGTGENLREQDQAVSERP